MAGSTGSESKRVHPPVDVDEKPQVAVADDFLRNPHPKLTSDEDVEDDEASDEQFPTPDVMDPKSNLNPILEDPMDDGDEDEADVESPEDDEDDTPVADDVLLVPAVDSALFHDMKQMKD